VNAGHLFRHNAERRRVGLPRVGTMWMASDFIAHLATLDATSIGLRWLNRPDVAASISSYQKAIR